ncbi:MAG: M23 family metallopeptidase [Flavobacteriaceae bacterium]|nr:M23 family metallopeptidase [Flavobacteriaceae bacterium]
MVITLKINTAQEARNRRREYTLTYKSDLKEKGSFNKNSSVFLLRFCHLEDVLVKVGDKVKAGDIIGKSGISGVIAGTSDPHLHFNI